MIRMWIINFFRNLFGFPLTVVRVVERYAPGSGSVIASRPEICIMAPDHQRLLYNIRECPEEISGLALLDYDKEANTITISDLKLLEQKVTAAMTDLDQVAIGKLMTQMIQENKDTAALKVWWHSHVDGRVYWSDHQDKVTIRNLGEFGFDYLISIVGNHYGQLLCRLDIFQPIHITLDNLPIRIIHPDDAILRQEVKNEIQDKVTFVGGNRW